MAEPLKKVDSAVQGLSSDAPAKTKRASSSVPGVYNINDLGKSGIRIAGWAGTQADSYGCVEAAGTELQIAKETQKTGW
jgi:hypothetical protein